MTTKYSRLLAAAAISVSCIAWPTHATTITLDELITQPPGAVPPVDVGPGLALDYETPEVPPGPPDAFYTQGFAFGGRTAGVTVPAYSRPGFGIVIDPAVCGSFGTACADNGTRFLAFDIAASVVRMDLGAFSVVSFSASQAYEDDTACPDCNEGIGIQNAQFVQVNGFNGGALVARETFALSFAFQSFALLDPGWANVERVVFQPLDAEGNPGIADVNPCCTLALDDIRTHAVTEPAPLLLLGTGLAVLAMGRRNKRKGAQVVLAK